MHEEHLTAREATHKAMHELSGALIATFYGVWRPCLFPLAF